MVRNLQLPVSYIWCAAKYRTSSCQIQQPDFESFKKRRLFCVQWPVHYGHSVKWHNISFRLGAASATSSELSKKPSSFAWVFLLNFSPQIHSCASGDAVRLECRGPDEFLLRTNPAALQGHYGGLQSCIPTLTKEVWYMIRSKAAQTSQVQVQSCDEGREWHNDLSEPFGVCLLIL